MKLTQADRFFLARCNQLALNAFGNTYPNPLVGAVCVHNQRIIGEGFHIKAGGPHAEINAINSVRDKSILASSTLYVNLEPCNHHGKTPACTHAIVSHKIPKVVISQRDPNPMVNRQGIQYLEENGVKVLVQKASTSPNKNINKRFFTYHLKKRPYIILKYAQSSDGFIDDENKETRSITGDLSKQLSHKWRTEEQAILIGKNTYLKDNPSLNPRLWFGNDNAKFVIDKDLIFPHPNHLFEQKKVHIFNQIKNSQQGEIKYIRLNFEENIIPEILDKLYELEIQSIIVEGGSNTIQSFVNNDLWDEARVFTNPNLVLKTGIRAPQIPYKNKGRNYRIGEDELQYFYND